MTVKEADDAGFPTASEVLRDLVRSDIRSERRQRLFFSCSKFFRLVRHAEERRLQMMATAAHGHNPYDLVSPSSHFVYPELSFSVLLEGNEPDYLLRAAKLVYATLQFRRALLCDEIDKERYGDVTLDNSRYRHLFSRVVNIDIDRPSGRWNKIVTETRDSRHIVVVVRGRFYPILVHTKNGEIVDLAKIHSRLIAMVSHAMEPNDVPFSVLTTGVTRDSIKLFNNCRSDLSIQIIDQALFVLAIDVDQYCEDDNEAARAIHIRGYRNREYRKSLQLVVLASGRAGIVCNLLAGVEGVIAARFASWIAMQERILPGIGKSDPSVVKPLEFEGLRNVPYEPIADALERMICKNICELPMIQRIDTIGKDRIKDLHVSPDGFFHAALHWSFYERFRRLPKVHNFADLRAVQFGSITRYLSTTPQVAKFVGEPSRATLLEAARAHGRRAAAVKSGDNPLHYFSYYYGGHKTRGLLAVALLSIFIPGWIKKYRFPDVWASNIPALPGIVCAGRFGAYFRRAGRKCLVGNYMLFPDHITICFTSNNSKILDSWKTHASLSNTMTKMAELL